MAADSVKVAVRVRPFSQRELLADASCIISMKDNSTTITNPDTGDKKTFSFDHSYWSHSGFIEDENKVYLAESKNSQYADQRQVFTHLGQGVLHNAWAGYNAALFAYGQTGSGKSYSMLGYGRNKGIVPITCGELFSIIQKNKDTNIQYQVTFSMLEIYNEQVRDLLASMKQPWKGGLKVRQHPTLGFYVEGLKQVPVQKYSEMEKLMDHGTINRTTASTNMNATSSRSHMVITVRFKQVTKSDEQKMFVNASGDGTTKSSEINLVDLAGSERADSSGATGDRLREGSAINQSLSTLGNVISALADIGMGKKKVRVPYRDSVLTKLLQSALGGNSRTVMIAALSPADINYEETLSTLRYADRAKQIQNKAVINESPTDRLIRELKEENQRLLEQISRMHGLADTTKSEDLERLLKVNESQMSEMQLSWEQRLTEARTDWERSHSAREVDMSWKLLPYIENVNEDPQLSGVIKHCFPTGESILGKGGDDVTIELKGLAISSRHAVIYNNGEQVTITPVSSQTSVSINGHVVTKTFVLEHLSRIKFGSNSLFLYIGFPSERSSVQSNNKDYDYNFFQTELAESGGFVTINVFSPSPREKRHSQGPGIPLTRRRSSSLVDPHALIVFQEYINLLPMINEANGMSEELQKNVVFEPEVKNLATHDAMGNSKEKEVIVNVTNKTTNQVWVWSKAKFINRKFLIEELYSKWSEGENIDVDQSVDPFWDPIEDVFLGSCHVWLQSLAYCLDTDEHMVVQNYHGEEEAVIHVKIVPCDMKGKLLKEEMMVVDPSELLSNQLNFIIAISQALGVRWVRADNTRGVYCRFKFFDYPETVKGKTVWHSTNAQLNFKKQFAIAEVTQEFLNYLQTHALVIELWGTQEGSETSLGSNEMYMSENSLTRPGVEGDQISLEDELERSIEEISHLKHLLKEKDKEMQNLKKEMENIRRINHKLKDNFDKMKKKSNDSHMKPGLRRQTSVTVVESRENLNTPSPVDGHPSDTVFSDSAASNSNSTMDAAIAKGLKVFFKDVQLVQTEMAVIKNQKIDGDRATMKVRFEDHKESLSLLESDLTACVNSLKQTMLSVIQRKKQDLS